MECNHFGPGLKGLACTGNSLIGAHKAFGNAVIPHQGMQSGNIALQRAVGLYGNEAAFGTKARALSGDNFNMLRVDLRHDHRDIRRKTVRAVV